MKPYILPRGIRNHNPGNIKLSKVVWRGQKPVLQQMDTKFIEFIAPEYGLRAMYRLFLCYYFKYNLTTIEELINRYAPPYENATDGYIRDLQRRMGGSKRRAPLNFKNPEVLIDFCKGVVCHENGTPPKDYPKDWYADDVYRHAIEILYP